MRECVTFCSQGGNSRTSGTQAELDTLQLLKTNLKERVVGNYHILMNYNMPIVRQDGMEILEIDLLVINRFGIFVIEVKDWRGITEAYDGYWLQNRKHEYKNVFVSVNNKARKLHATWFDKGGKLSDGLSGVRVEGLIVLAQGKKNFFNYSNYDDRIVISLSDVHSLAQALSSSRLLPDSRNQKLSNDDISRIKDALYNEHRERKDILIGSYQVVGELTPGDLFEAFEAVNVTIETQRVRIKRYLLDDVSSKSTRSVEDFQRGARAVFKMGDNEHILRTMDFFPDPDRPDVFYEITEFVRGNRLDEILAQHDEPVSLEKQLDYVEPLCKALIHAHKHDVYHRNLNPETVFITEDGIVKLADFDFAKMLNTSHTVGPLFRDLAISPMTAPELRNNPSAASPASDIYSLGALWYSLASLPEKNPQIAPQNVEALNLPKSARELLAQMLVEQVNRRPSTGYVLEQIRRLREETKQ